MFFTNRAASNVQVHGSVCEPVFMSFEYIGTKSLGRMIVLCLPFSETEGQGFGGTQVVSNLMALSL